MPFLTTRPVMLSILTCDSTPDLTLKLKTLFSNATIQYESQLTKAHKAIKKYSYDIIFFGYLMQPSTACIKELIALPLESRPLMIQVIQDHERINPRHMCCDGVLFMALPLSVQVSHIVSLVDKKNVLSHKISSLIKENANLTLRLNASTEMHSELGIAERMNRIVRLLKKLVGADCVDIYFNDVENGQLINYSATQAIADIKTIPINRRSRLGMIALNKQWIQTSRWIGIPLLSNDIVIGVIVLIRNQKSFDASQLELLHQLEPQLRTAIKNAKRYADAQESAWLDGLTGLYNRVYFDNTLNHYLTKKVNPNRQLGLIIIDIDYFKTINDTYGHLIGDYALKLVADRLRSIVRQTDAVCRFGGEEFCILLPNSTPKRIQSIVQLAREKVSQSTIAVKRLHAGDHAYEYIDSSNVNQGSQNQWVDSHKVPLTISIGSAIYPGDFESSFKSTQRLKEATSEADLLVYMADKALYKSKKTGRNRALSYNAVQSSKKSNHVPPLQVIKKELRPLQKKDPDTYFHCIRVGYIAYILAQTLRHSESDCQLVKWGGMLHDVGKREIDDAILLKPTALTPSEYEQIKTHAKRGADIIKPIKELHRYHNIILHHHEQYQGDGYPHQLMKTQIPWEARLVAVADAYDAMTMQRIYQTKQTNPEDYAKSELKRWSGVMFDPIVVEAFFQCYDRILELKNNKNLEIE